MTRNLKNSKEFRESKELKKSTIRNLGNRKELKKHNQEL